MFCFCLGEADCTPNLLDFTHPHQFWFETTACANTELNPDCTVFQINNDSVGLHYDEEYCFILKLEGTSGISTYVYYDFRYHSGIPRTGYINEIEPSPNTVGSSFTFPRLDIGNAT